jgi:hypothetical protein
MKVQAGLKFEARGKVGEVACAGIEPRERELDYSRLNFG